MANKPTTSNPKKQTSPPPLPKKTTYSTHTVQQSFGVSKPKQGIPKDTKIEPSKEMIGQAKETKSPVSSPPAPTKKPFQEWKTYHLLNVHQDQNKFMIKYIEILYVCGCKTEADLYLFLSALFTEPITSLKQIEEKDLHQWLVDCTGKDPVKEKLSKEDLMKIKRIISLTGKGVK